MKALFFLWRHRGKWTQTRQALIALLKRRSTPAGSLLLTSHHARFRVRFHHTDAAGIVFFSVFFEYFEDALIEFFRAHGVSVASLRSPEHDFKGLPIVEAHCEYKEPAWFDDFLTVTTRVTMLQGKAFRTNHTVVRDSSVLCEGYLTRVAVNWEGRARSLPPPIYQALQEDLEKERNQKNAKSSD